jgi:hypothetical protein
VAILTLSFSAPVAGELVPILTPIAKIQFRHSLNEANNMPGWERTTEGLMGVLSNDTSALSVGWEKNAGVRAAHAAQRSKRPLEWNTDEHGSDGFSRMLF